MNRMRAKNQLSIPSEVDAKEKLIVYVYEYLTHCGAKNAAMSFLREIQCEKDIQINEGPGFLSNWWCVFWDLYCAAPDKRNSLPECSSEARAFIDYRNVMSPNIPNPSPPQPPQPFIGAPGGMSVGIPGQRYVGPPIRGPPPGRMQAPPGPPPPQPAYVNSMVGSPRYQSHKTPPGPPGSMYPEAGPSPVSLNRLTPHSASPHPQSTPTPQMAPQPSGSGGPLMPMQGGQRLGPPPMSQPAWQPNYNVNSPVGQPGGYMMMGGDGLMELKNDGSNDPSAPQPSEDTYEMPSFPENDQNETAEIMKVKQSLQEQTKQQEFGGYDYNQ